VVARLGKDGGSIALVVTHLHARYSPPGEPDEYLGIRGARVAGLIGDLSGLDGPVVAVGDFNMREGASEYECFIGLTGLVDAAAFLDTRQATVLADNPYLGVGHHGDERIDYCFVNREVRPVAVRRDFDESLGRYSDHAGLVATIELSEQSRLDSAGSADRGAARVRLGELLEQGRSAALRRRELHRLRAAGLATAAILGSRLGERAAAGLLLAGAIGEVLLAERFVRTELRGFDYAQLIVDGIPG
jgi:hypothetical protein